MKTTIKDIARMAGVSITAVSLVLNNRENKISEAKKKEIRRLAQEYDYVPSYVARNLVMKKSNTIGVLIPDIENFFFSKFVKNVEDALREHGYYSFVSNSGDKYHNDMEIIRNYINRGADGLLIIVSNESYSHEDEMIAFLEKIKIPFVLVDRVYQDIRCHKVCFDNRYGGYLATKYLLDKGYKNIACLTTRDNSENGRLRYLGYVDAITEAGLSVNEEFIFRGDYNFESGYLLAEEIFKNTDITAVVAINDLVAYGVIKKAREYGRAVPGDVFVVGYDNLEYSNMFGINLPSIEQDVTLLAKESVEILIKCLKEKTDVQIRSFKPVLVEN